MADHPILILADDLFYRRLAESQLPDAAASLPALDEQTVQTLVQEADRLGQINPRQGWAIMKVMDAAASHTPTLPFLQAQIAWHLARHTNEYGRFPEAQEPLARARNIFAAQKLSPWLALCTWQENWLVWTSSHLPQGLSHLQQVLEELKQAGEFFTPYVPQCQLSLAAFQLVTGDPDSATAHINEAEKVFRTAQDTFNLARCLSLQISLARLKKDNNKALSYLHETYLLVAEWPGEKAKMNLAQGYLQWLHDGDYAGAIATFTEAIHTFDALDMPVWVAQAQNGLAQVYIATGNSKDAGSLLQQALHQASVHEATGLQIAILLDMGWYQGQRGRSEQALAALQSAAQLAEQVGNVSMQAAILMHIGDACIQLGRFQLALRYLEKSHDQFKQMNNSGRLAEGEIRLGQTWLALGQAQMAQRYLSQAKEHALQANHPTILPYYYYHSARTFLAQKQPKLTLTALEEGLQVAQQQNDPHTIALMQRSLATLLLTQKKPTEAFTHLTAATSSFQAMDMFYEALDCLIAWGDYHSQMGDEEQARQVWEQALEQSLDLMPDISWLAADGLARLAEKRRGSHIALKHYHQMREALSQIRQGFLQPELASHFNHRPAASLDRAFHLAGRVGTSRDVLAFIEENKAHLITRQMAHHTLPVNPSSAELQTQLAEIRWLQETLRTTPSAQYSWQSSPLQQQLRTLIEAYNNNRSRWQRTETEEQTNLAGITFDQDEFRQKATAVLGQEWLGLDYYLTEEQIQVVVITPGGSYTWAKKISPWAGRALLDMERYGWQAEEDEDYSPLKVLGQFLFPEGIVRQLTPTTTLIIAPHRQLHRVPWPALEVEGKPLVAHCIPALTLSFTNLLALWSRPRTHSAPLASGLLLAISAFPDYRSPLPDVSAECALVEPLLGQEGHSLCEETATWDNFLALHQERDLSRFSFWHVATHASHEHLTGRLSGISFYDRDVWLDELWQCSPLPQLVTLSACSGSKSKVHEGDEHVSLATTCLSAGAHTVVGSLWPVSDKAMPELMRTYYNALAAGKSAALALALAQRHAWQEGDLWQLWGGLTCTGAP